MHPDSVTGDQRALSSRPANSYGYSWQGQAPVKHGCRPPFRNPLMAAWLVPSGTRALQGI